MIKEWLPIFLNVEQKQKDNTKFHLIILVYDHKKNCSPPRTAQTHV